MPGSISNPPPTVVAVNERLGIPAAVMRRALAEHAAHQFESFESKGHRPLTALKRRLDRESPDYATWCAPARSISLGLLAEALYIRRHVGNKPDPVSGIITVENPRLLIRS
jgi:hypothetical protein